MDYVLFDLDDTLYDQADPFARAYREVFGDRYDVDPVAVFPVSRAYSESVFEASEHGQMPMERMYVYRIQRALADFGVEATDEECLRMHYLYAELQESDIAVSPTMEELLGWCAERVGLGIVSNGPVGHQMKKFDVLGLERWIPRNNMFVSSAIGVAKPDPRHFLIACDRLGTQPARCLFVGDSFAPDVMGAHNAHMPVVWFDRRGRPATTNVMPDATVHTEQELLGLLRDHLA